jgi:hypothetical protein
VVTRKQSIQLAAQARNVGDRKIQVRENEINSAINPFSLGRLCTASLEFPFQKEEKVPRK